MTAASEGRNAVIGEKDEQGAVAQLGEHLLCKQKVTGSIPVSSTTAWDEDAPEKQAQIF